MKIFSLFIILLYPQVFANTTESHLTSEERREQRRKLEYDSLDHWVTITFLRAGNHDTDSGLNQYYIKVELIGLLDEESQHLLKFEKKKKIVKEYGTFAELDLKAFTSYKDDTESKNRQRIQIKGDEVREIVRQFMTDFQLNDKTKIPEYQVGVLVKLHLYEKQKKMFIINDDQLLHEIDYYVLPFSSSETPLRQSQEKLTLNDAAGFHIELSIIYHDPETEAQS